MSPSGSRLASPTPRWWLVGVALAFGVSHGAWAAPAPLPPDAPARQARLLAPLPANAQSWIAAEAQRVAGGEPPSSVRGDIGREFPRVTKPADIDALVFLVLMQADADLQHAAPTASGAAGAPGWGQSTVLSGQPNLRSAPSPAWGSSPSAVSDTSQMNLQQLTSQRQQVEQGISNMMKSMSDTSQGIVDNMKS